MASLTMLYMDAINVASERSYVHAREDMGRSVDEATRLFLSRLMRAGCSCHLAGWGCRNHRGRSRTTSYAGTATDRRARVTAGREQRPQGKFH